MPEPCLKQRHVLPKGCQPAHYQALCNPIPPHFHSLKGVLRKKGLSMLIKDSKMDQRTSLDHQCDLGASISHLDVRTAARQSPVGVEAVYRVAGGGTVLGSWGAAYGPVWWWMRSW